MHRLPAATPPQLTAEAGLAHVETSSKSADPADCSIVCAPGTLRNEARVALQPAHHLCGTCGGAGGSAWLSGEQFTASSPSPMPLLAVPGLPLPT